MAKTYAEIAATLRTEADTVLARVNEALTAKDMDAYSASRKTLDTSVSNLNKALANEAFAGFLETENPIVAAVKAFYIKTIKVKEKTNDAGIITSVEFEDRNSRIDLEKFCDFAELDMQWVHDSSRLLAKLVLRETDVYNIAPAELSKKSYYFTSQVKAKKEGETPDSNTQIVKLLQKIIDETLGEGVHKCTNHDMAFIQDALTKLDTKEKCTIATINERQFKTVIMSVLAHALGEAYQVKAAKIKNA